MDRVSASKPDLFMRNIEEGAPLGAVQPSDTGSRAQSTTGEPPEHSPAGREEVGNV